MKVFGVMGYPISHSMSPTMHNELYKFLNMEAIYHAFEVKPEQLQSAVNGLKALGITGANVTIPHKENVISFLDELDPLAESIGAVNTIHLKDNKLIGYNTDGLGYLHSLQTDFAQEDLKTKKTLIIGAGGAARGIYLTLAASGFENLDICNRTLEKASNIISDNKFQTKSSAYTLVEVEEIMDSYDLVIQTTSVGLYPNTNEIPISFSKVKQDSIFSDIIYNPMKTSFLSKAEQLGARVHNGLGMFIFQGALAFEIWTGLVPDTELMKATVIKQLQLGGTT